MKRETVYIADDGTRFEGLNAYFKCRQYEIELEEERFLLLQEYIRFYDYNAQPLKYSLVNAGHAPYYSQVLRIPDEDDEGYEIWAEVVPSGLDEEICNYGEGWYVTTDEHNYDNWSNLLDEFNKQAAIIAKLEKGN